VFKGHGFLFAGRSGAGTSTIAMMLKERAEILCDDRIIVRRWPEGFRIHGTWSHGEVPDVSPTSALLRAIMFLEKGSESCLIPINNKKESIRRFLACLIRPFVTRGWWENVLTLIDEMVREIPFFILRFRRDSNIVEILEKLIQAERSLQEYGISNFRHEDRHLHNQG